MYEIEADTSDACRVKPLKVRVGDVCRQDRDGARRVAQRSETGKGDAVVEAVGRRLNDHTALRADDGAILQVI
ncbi:hypothetical protein ABLW52_24035, partial [Salmonella enterica]